MKLHTFIIRRLALLIPVLFGVTLLIFAVLQLFSPMERAALFVTSPEQMRDLPDIIQKYGLDEPVWVQYGVWMNQVLQGNLGWSKIVSMPVMDALFFFLPATIELALFTAPLIILAGILLGSLAAAHKGKAIDHATRVLAIGGWSLPTFWLGLILLMVFYGYFAGLLPPGRLGVEASLFVNSPDFVRYTRLNTVDALLNGELWILANALRHLILPAITLAVVTMAILMRIMRSSMLEALGKGYILTARAKGLDEGTVIGKHARRNALIPVMTVSGFILAGLMNGVVITEVIFNYKGVGWWAAQSALRLDIPSLLGFTLFNGVLFVITNLVVDLLYARIDPRVRLGAAAR